MVEILLINAEHSLQGRPRDWATNRDTYLLVKILIAELIPSELEKGTHAMRDLTQEQDTAVPQTVGDPAPEASLGFGGVQAADGGVLTFAHDLNGPENNPKSSFDTGA